MPSKTSIKAYREIESDGTKLKQVQKVYLCIDNCQPVTRREIGRITNLELGAVAGRVNELLADKKIDVCGETRCPTTNKMVGMLSIN